MSDADRVSGELVDGLAQTSFTVIALLTRTAAEHDVSLTQLRALAILRDREPTMAQLAEFLGLERSSVSGLMDRAVRRGLVRRTVSADDGRAVHVSLTAAGHRLAEQVGGEVADLLAPMTSRLSTAEQKRLTTLLVAMLDQPDGNQRPS
ncbi:MarR family transcriptional regulator [Mycobacterium sp. RTGN5]|uniref:MarR family winged helix-turn-helix transcriptional regulator n=1 Tax=Mycobacterium sp. RTGN5 TaxID=3016522 RepID=UPI0029C8BC5C|nr:MarR family transcriptional regulator [Mycobacterium sp. RTGN5]